MPKNIPAQVITQMDAETKRPALLLELGLSSTLRFACHKSNITFPTGGNVYTAKAIKVRGISQSLEGQIQRIVIDFDNVVKDMAAYAHYEDFKGKSLIIKRVYLDAMGDASYYNEVFNGYMEYPSNIGRYWLSVPAVTGKPLAQKVLKCAYQKLCPWVFGDARCNTNGNADLTSLKTSGTADSGSTTTLTDNALTQANDYWNHGRIEITKGSKTYYRKVADFNATTDTITLDVELPVAVDGTCTYVLYKGCDQTWDTCGANNAWGPSANNEANFGGCIHIARAAVDWTQPSASETTPPPDSTSPGQGLSGWGIPPGPPGEGGEEEEPGEPGFGGWGIEV